jgi:hypothetical protein
VLSEGYALLAGNVEGFWELLDPTICLSFRFGVVAIEDDDNTLSFLHDSWPYSVVLDVAYVQ